MVSQQTSGWGPVWAWGHRAGPGPRCGWKRDARWRCAGQGHSSGPAGPGCEGPRAVGKGAGPVCPKQRQRPAPATRLPPHHGTVSRAEQMARLWCWEELPGQRLGGWGLEAAESGWAAAAPTLALRRSGPDPCSSRHGPALGAPLGSHPALTRELALESRRSEGTAAGRSHGAHRPVPMEVTPSTAGPLTMSPGPGQCHSVRAVQGDPPDRPPRSEGKGWPGAPAGAHQRALCSTCPAGTLANCLLRNEAPGSPGVGSGAAPGVGGQAPGSPSPAGASLVTATLHQFCGCFSLCLPLARTL